MRLIRHGPKGSEKFGIVDDDGVFRDASTLVGEIDESELAAIVEIIASTKATSLPLVPAGTRLGCPVARVGKVVCVGLNYSDHAEESGMALPSEPVLFMKATTSLSGPNDDICIPSDALKVDWEVELGVVIGKRATRISEAEAFDYVIGYTIVHDVSERAFQLERGGQWLKGKSLDTFCPVGPWLLPSGAVADPQALDMYLEVNGKRMQEGTTATMVFNVAHLVSYISTFMTLEPGDIIATGTPAGVGFGQKPPAYLKVGDEVRLGIEGLGEQRQAITLAETRNR